jgi:hypothetical protein
MHIKLITIIYTYTEGNERGISPGIDHEGPEWGVEV